MASIGLMAIGVLVVALAVGGGQLGLFSIVPPQRLDMATIANWNFPLVKDVNFRCQPAVNEGEGMLVINNPTDSQWNEYISKGVDPDATIAILTLPNDEQRIDKVVTHTRDGSYASPLPFTDPSQPRNYYRGVIFNPMGLSENMGWDISRTCKYTYRIYLRGQTANVTPPVISPSPTPVPPPPPPSSSPIPPPPGNQTGSQPPLPQSSLSPYLLLIGVIVFFVGATRKG